VTSGQRASQSKFEDWLLYYPWNLLQGLFLCSSNVRDLIELTLFLEDNKARLTTAEVSVIFTANILIVKLNSKSSILRNHVAHI
jgi:hypothetical protein